MGYLDKNGVPYVIPKDGLDAENKNRPIRAIADNIDIVSSGLSDAAGHIFQVPSGVTVTGVTWLYQYNIVSGDPHKDAIDKLDKAIGGRDIYTPGRYITSGEPVAVSLDKLQLALVTVDNNPDYLNYLGQKMGLDPFTPPSSLDPNYSTWTPGYAIPHYRLNTSGYFITLESGIGLIDKYVGRRLYVENSYLEDNDSVGSALNKLEGSTHNIFTVGDNKKSFGKYSNIQEAMTAAALTKGTVFVKRGRYLLSAPVEIPEDVNLDGEGYATEIYYNVGSVNSLSTGAFVLKGRNQVSNFYLQRGGNQIRVDELDPFAALTTLSHNYTGVSFDVDAQGFIHLVTINWYSPITILYDVYKRTPEGFVRVEGRRKTWTDSGLGVHGAIMVRATHDGRAVIALATDGGSGTNPQDYPATDLKYNLQKRDGTWGGWVTVTTNADPQYNDNDAEHGFALYAYKKRPVNYSHPSARFYIVWKDKSTAQLKITKFDEGGSLDTYVIDSTGPGTFDYRHDKEVWMDVNEETDEVHIFRPITDVGGGGGQYHCYGYFDKNDNWVTVQARGSRLWYWNFASVTGAIDKHTGKNTIFITGSCGNDSPPQGLAVCYKRPEDTNFRGPFRYTARGGNVQELNCDVDGSGRLHVAFNYDNKFIDWVIFDPEDNTFTLMHSDGPGVNFRYPQVVADNEGAIIIMWQNWTELPSNRSGRIRALSSLPAFTFEGYGHYLKNIHVNMGDLILPLGTKAEGVLVTYRGK